MVELKPCPFCGGEAFMHEYYYPDFGETYYVRCEKCDTESAEYEARATAVMAWNGRTESEELKFTREFQFFALASAWKRRVPDG